MRGVQCNEMINDGVDKLLHDWQLKFNMIGWSGGFISDLSASNDMDVYVPRDPPGEREEDISSARAQGDEGFAVRIQSEQQHRIHSIVKVLAHYEEETITPFKVIGLTVTRDVVTLILGFFGAAIIGVCTRLLDKTMDGDTLCRMFCHRALN